MASIISPSYTTNANYELPPFYTTTDDINTWLLDIFNGTYGLPCICGDQSLGTDIYVVRPRIVRICQRESTPCMVEVDFHLGTAYGVYHYKPNSSGFSVDTTNGVDGIWHQLRPETSDLGHNPSRNNTSLAGSTSVDGTWEFWIFNPNNPLHGSSCSPNLQNLRIPVHTFVFDMCEHINSWFSENSVSFRLTFDKVSSADTIPRSCGIIVT